MTARPFRREDTGDTALDRVQRRVEDAQRPLESQPLLDGLHVRGASVGTGETEVAHGLGRRPVGVLLGVPMADARVWQVRPATSRLLFLQASADVTLDVYVF